MTASVADGHGHITPEVLQQVTQRLRAKHADFERAAWQAILDGLHGQSIAQARLERARAEGSRARRARDAWHRYGKPLVAQAIQACGLSATEGSYIHNRSVAVQQMVQALGAPAGLLGLPVHTSSVLPMDSGLVLVEPHGRAVLPDWTTLGVVSESIVMPETPIPIGLRVPWED